MYRGKNRFWSDLEQNGRGSQNADCRNKVLSSIIKKSIKDINGVKKELSVKNNIVV